MAKFRRTLAIDFDGVIHSYTSGWNDGGPHIIEDPPVEGAFQFIYQALEHFDVVIYTTRAETEEAKQAIYEWFRKHKFDLDALDKLTVSDAKPKAIVYLDDRAWCFTGKFPDIEKLKRFKPWYKRDYKDLKKAQRRSETYPHHNGAELVVKADVNSAMHLRTVVANAEVEDGRTVEIATNIDGSMLATIRKKGEEGWVTYAITPSALCEAVIAAEQRNDDHQRGTDGG